MVRVGNVVAKVTRGKSVLKNEESLGGRSGGELSSQLGSSKSSGS